VNSGIEAKLIVIWLLGCALASCDALAQGASDASRLPRQNWEEDASIRPWDFGVWFAAATGEENTNSFGEAQILSAGVFAGKTLTGEVGRGWRRGRLEFGFDVFPLFAQLRPLHLYGTGFDPIILRWNSSLRRGRVVPFIELGGGAVRTTRNLPAGDTSNFNFVARGGGGVQVATRRNQSLELSLRWWHVSNANLGARNPEFNGVQFSVGWHWHR